MQRIDHFAETLKRGGADFGTSVKSAILLRQLDEGNYSCVIEKNDEIRTYNQRGVKDLYQLAESGDGFTQGALLADKIIGKGAAALAIVCGVKTIRTHVICTSALEMLKKYNVKTIFETEVDHIENRTKTDWCPLEKRVKECATAEECMPIIRQFIADLEAGKI